MFEPGTVWYDTDGHPIQAHGGGILYEKGTFYWFGENKDGLMINNRMDVIGISCYSSQDLYSWKNEGVVLPAVHDDEEHDLHFTKIVERPKVIYNMSTNTYTMWMHIDSADYSYARTGVAVSDTPTGPYRYLGSIEPCGTDSRDMTLYKDDDEVAYVIFSSEYNRNITIARLSADYLSTTEVYVKILQQPHRNEGREAPALFKHNNTYFLITSGCTGWLSNAASYATAPSPLGPWTTRGNPCVGIDAEKTFYAQSTFVLPIPNQKDIFIFMADRWNSIHLSDSRYVWLPLYVNDETLTIQWHDSWDISNSTASLRR